MTATLIGAAAVVTQAQRINRGRMELRADTALDQRPENLFGVNAALLDAPADDLDAALETIAATGFGWIRQEFAWSTMEPQRGQFDWTAADRVIEAAREHELRVIALLNKSPGWARAGRDHATAPPDDPLALADFAAAFAARYGDEIDVYQIWDEPNLRSGWGGEPPNPAAYARLLESAYESIHTADPTAHVLLAGLAPTVESGPANLNEVLFLRRLYQQGASAFFDAAAAKPYGFAAHPADRQVAVEALNFSRMILLREEMEAAGDGEKLLWASNFGWNALPLEWSGAPSLWDAAAPEEQADRTWAAFSRARNEWPWAGVLVLENYQPDAARADPRWGFALVDADGNATLTLVRLQENLPGAATVAAPGIYPATSRFAVYRGGWEFSDLGADIPQFGPAEIEFTFEGTAFGVVARRDNYRAYLYAEIDGQPANGLPRDGAGRAYALLTSGDLLPRTETIWLARNLAAGRHTAKVVAERGWDQWAIVGFVVDNRAGTAQPVALLSGLIVLVFAGGFGTWFFGRDTELGQRMRSLGGRAHFVVAAALAALVWASAWLTWGTEAAQSLRRYGDAAPLFATAATAGLFYFSPWLIVTLLSMAALFVTLLLRPEFALPLIALLTPFYLLPKPLFERAFSLVEVVTLMAAAALVLHVAAKVRVSRITYHVSRITTLDWAVVAFVAVGVSSTLFAANRAVALTELRTMALEPFVVYLLLRVLPLRERDVWRTVDCWILGGALVAVIGLAQYVAGENVITAEGGVARLRSVYGSPNNVGLYLGRLLPIAAAVALLGRRRGRRLLYLGAGALLGAALVLSLSRGAILLGAPAALAVVALFWQGRRAAYALAGLGAAGVAALLPLSRHPRFAELLNLSTGPTFFRLNLWRSTLSMIRDHPVVGVGLDNFLYEYRGNYILPAAWQDPNLSHAHNWALDFAARLGLPGLLIAVWLLLAFFRAGGRALRSLSAQAKSRRALTIGLMASMVNFLAHGLVDASYWFIDLSFAFMLTVGLMHWLDENRTFTAAAR